MRTRFKPPEIYISHFKTLIELMALLNSRTQLGERVREFIDKLRQVPGKKREPILFQSAESRSLDEALENVDAELHKDPWTIVIELEWGRDVGRSWNIRPDLGNEYQTWLWAVLDYDRSGVIDRIHDCPQCGKTFMTKPRGSGKYCARTCAQKAHRSQPDHKERAKKRNRVYMQKRRFEDSLESVTAGKWERLVSAGYVYRHSGICQTCGAKIEWWRTPPRRKTRGRLPRRVNIPVQKISGNRIRTHWPHKRS